MSKKIGNVLIAWFLLLTVTWCAGWWLPGHELSDPESYYRLALAVLALVSGICAWVTTDKL